jgi:hypothetical protein
MGSPRRARAVCWPFAGSSVLALCCVARIAVAEPPSGARPAAKTAQVAPADAGEKTGDVQAAPLPAEHRPRLSLDLEPKSGVVTGDVVRLTLRADALQGDDVTVPEQSFAPFEVKQKRARVEPAKDGRQQFVFEIELLAIEPGKHEQKPIELRVVTKDGFVGSIQTAPLTVNIGSLLANEPNAQLKPPTKPVVVTQDDYTILYVLGGLFAAALIALLSWLGSRYWQRRQRPAPPPPPPRPAWEIAIEKLGELRRRKQRMVDEGKAAQFVDEVSDVVREYLGAHFGFDGLETTTDEMLGLLRKHQANAGLLQEIGAYLRRCDLVKFAKVDPDQDEADLVLAKAQDIVQFSMPLGDGYRDQSGHYRGPAAHAPGATAASADTRPGANAAPSGGADPNDGRGTPQ